MEIIELTQNIRNKLANYRYAHKNIIVSKHINAIDIAVSLVEYAIEDKRPIGSSEENWFEATYQIDYLLSGSDWEDLSDMYSQLVTEVKKRNYFRR